MTAWWAILIGALVTYLARASFISFGGQRPLPPIARRFLIYVGPAAFAAIVAPRVLVDEASGELTVDARLIAIIVGAIVMWRTKNLIAMLVLGMVTLWVLTWIGW